MDNQPESRIALPVTQLPDLPAVSDLRGVKPK